ncbi:MAG: hypothetical protein ABI359_11125 [Ginsengibacter sp.]
MRKDKFKIIICFILVFLIITNPSLETFKDYAGIQQKNTAARRNYNFFIFSIYQNRETRQLSEDTDEGYSIYTHYYLGIADNFFNLNSK